MTFTITPLHPADWEAVRTIYEEGIATGNATFETAVPTWEVWDQGHLPLCRLVARNDSGILGWVALSPISSREVYAGVAWEAIYIAESARGQGIGKALLEALIESSEQAGIWTLQAGIFPENVGSIRLHESCGFRVVGTRERIGQMHGVWRDVVLMERRSQIAGK